MSSEAIEDMILKAKGKINRKMAHYLVVAVLGFLLLLVAVLGSSVETAHSSARIRNHSSKKLRRMSSTLSDKSFDQLAAVSEFAELKMGHRAEELEEESPGSQYQRLSGELSESQSLGSSVLQVLNDVKTTNDLPKDRMLVHKGDISLSAPPEEGEALSIQIEDLIKSEGGYLENKSSHNSDWIPVISLTARIPSSQFHAFIAQLKGIGKVMNLDVSSEDVTDSFVDANTRAQTLQASIQSLQALMTKADTVDDVLKVQEALNPLTQEYESQKARANSLQKQSSLSTLNIRIQEEKKDNDNAAQQQSGFVSGLVSTFQFACEDVLETFDGLANFVVYLSVIVLAIAIPACCLSYLAYRVCILKGNPKPQF